MAGSHFSDYRKVLRQFRQRQFVYVANNDPSSSEEQSAFEAELEQLAYWLHSSFAQADRLNQVTTQIISGRTLNDVLNLSYENFRALIPFDRMGCSLVSEDGNYITQYWARSNYDSENAVGNGYTVPFNKDSLNSFTQEQARPRIINDLKKFSSTRPGSKVSKLLLEEGILSNLTCPLIVDSKLIGYLFFSSRQANVYRDIHQEVFLATSSNVSHLVEKSRLYENVNRLNNQLSQALESLKVKASYDSLTGVYNRGSVMDFLKESLSSAAQKQRVMSLILCDIDFFKSVNDVHGHVVGDVVLKTVAQNLSHGLREYDAVGRYGGEEFLIILPGTESGGAIVVAERIRNTISELAFDGAKSPFNVTISMGIATTGINSEFSDEITLIKQADEALYQAKESGRNRVVLYRSS